MQLSPTPLGRAGCVGKFHTRRLSFPLFASYVERDSTATAWGETHHHERSAIMKRRRIIAGAICASTLIVALVEPAAADRWRHAPADSAYLHITTSSQYDPSDSISGAVRRDPRGAAPGRNLGALRLQLLF